MFKSARKLNLFGVRCQADRQLGFFILQVCLYRLNRRDFIKAFQICINYSHTIHLWKVDGQILNFVRIEAVELTVTPHMDSLFLFNSDLAAMTIVTGLPVSFQCNHKQNPVSDWAQDGGIFHRQNCLYLTSFHKCWPICILWWREQTNVTRQSDHRHAA